jgi:hypothetical protein
MASVFPRRAQPPALWAVFCYYLFDLSRIKMEQWWAALTVSRWSRATELRRLVQLHTDLDNDWRQVWSLYMQAMGPQGLMAVCEDLIQEGVMPPLTARRIEDSVLRQVDAGGRWKGA